LSLRSDHVFIHEFGPARQFAASEDLFTGRSDTYGGPGWFLANLSRKNLPFW